MPQETQAYPEPVHASKIMERLSDAISLSKEVSEEERPKLIGLLPTIGEKSLAEMTSQGLSEVIRWLRFHMEMGEVANSLNDFEKWVKSLEGSVMKAVREEEWNERLSLANEADADLKFIA